MRRTNPRTHDYQGAHSPPGPDEVADFASAPFHAVDGVMPDYYQHPNWYTTGDDRCDREGVSALLAAQGKPTANVTIYRAVPPGVRSINPGDWVTQSRLYAKQHLESNLDGEGKILKAVAKAGSLFTNGDSHLEWGWWPDKAREKAYADERARRLAPKWKAEREAREAKYGMTDAERWDARIAAITQKNPRGNPRLRLPADALIVTNHKDGKAMALGRLSVALADDAKALGYLSGTLVRKGYYGDNDPYWIVEEAAAESGYGPALYDAAGLIGAALGFPDLVPSDQQSEEARRLWAKNTRGVFGDWNTPSLEEFAKRYGIELSDLLERGLALDDYAQTETLKEGQYLYNRLIEYVDFEDEDEE